jgi:hypothetical protein
MRVTEQNVLTGPCGLYCALCSDYQASACPGCRTIAGRCLNVDGLCETYACSDAHGVEFCFECGDYPCRKLEPALDGADRLPHNVKVFNLAYIEHHGLAEWTKEAATIRELYFKGHMVIGAGPHLE